MSKKFLKEYQNEIAELSKIDQFRISQDAQHFTIEDVTAFLFSLVDRNQGRQLKKSQKVLKPTSYPNNPQKA